MILEHVNLTVRNLDQSIEFYCSLLGGHVRWRGHNSAGREAAHVGTDSHYLALFQACDAAKSTPLTEPDYDSPGFNHMAFVVNDMDAVIGRLEALGVQPQSDETYAPGRHVYFFDPDGVEVELVQY